MKIWALGLTLLNAFNGSCNFLQETFSSLFYRSPTHSVVFGSTETSMRSSNSGIVVRGHGNVVIGGDVTVSSRNSSWASWFWKFFRSSSSRGTGCSSVTIDGRTYRGKNSVVIKNNQVFIDGQKVSSSSGRENTLQGSGIEAEEKRNVNVYHKLMVTGPIQALLKPSTDSGSRKGKEKADEDEGDEEESEGKENSRPASSNTMLVKVNGDDNIISHLLTETKRGNLTIQLEPNLSYRLALPLKATCYLNNLQELHASGSSQITMNKNDWDETVFKRDAFKIVASGSAKINLRNLVITTLHAVTSGSALVTLQGDVDTCNVEIKGSGQLVSLLNIGVTLALKATTSGQGNFENIACEDVTSTVATSAKVSLKGTANRHTGTVSTSGLLDASNLQTNNATIKAATSGKSRIWVTEGLVATATTSGSIYYKGSPKLTKSTKTSGTVQAIRG